MFSPKILERLQADVFSQGVHIFISPPGAGKSTLLRAMTPAVLKAFWRHREIEGIQETAHNLLKLGVLDPTDGPQTLGVQLTCSSGYADLPTGASTQNDGLFRALLDCRIVLRTLRSLATHLEAGSLDELQDVTLEYRGETSELKFIPRESSLVQLSRWAEQYERRVYAALDDVGGRAEAEFPAHVRFEGVLWLHGVDFFYRGKRIVPRRLLMIDDLHVLRRQQRDMLVREMIDLRTNEPIWLAQRTSVLGEALLSRGTRDGRDVSVHDLDELWNMNSSRGFMPFAENVLDRRFEKQELLPEGTFEQWLKTEISAAAIENHFRKGVELYEAAVRQFRKETQYAEWLKESDAAVATPTLDNLRKLYSTRILIARNEGRGQLALVPLSPEELTDRDSSALQGAVEVFMRHELGVPYYYGIERLCLMATNNIEELLGLAAALYDALEANQMVRRPDIALTPFEQEKVLTSAAKKKKDFIPRVHGEGTRAQVLLEAMGQFCRSRTFRPNAPIAPGVTGIRLSQPELERLQKGGTSGDVASLRRVLADCVADNLLVMRDSSATSGREGGKTFYLNRTLCAHYGLPLQMGGWQDISVGQLLEWAAGRSQRGSTSLPLGA